MIKYDYEITVNGNQAKLNKDIYLFRGNKNVHYYFAVKNASFNFKGSTDLIEKTNAINAAVTVIKPNNVEVASAIAKVENGKIHLKVTEDLIDEEVEVGDFDLVFDLFDDTDGAVTIPKVIGQFHVLERPCTTPISELVATNTTNEVDQALTDYAIVTYAEPVASTNADGTFAKKTWVAKEKITTAELNRMEEGISDVSSQCKDIAKEVGTETLKTTAQDVKGAINEVFQNASNGKGLIATAITGKGVDASSSDTFAELATKIQQISGGSIASDTALGKKMYSFAVISDIHHGRTDYNVPEDTNKMLDGLEGLDVDFVCSCGDLVVDTPDTRIPVFKTLWDSKCTKTLYSCTGNHDAKVTESVWQQNIGHGFRYSFEKNGDAFIFMSVDNDVNITGTPADFYSESLDWLATKMQEYKGKRIFLFMHYPLYGYSGLKPKQVYGFASNSTESSTIAGYMSSIENLIIFSGHSHQPFNVEKLDTTYNNIKFYEINAHNSATIGMPSIGLPRNLDLSYITDTNPIEGMVVDVYEKGVIFRGYDFVNNDYMDEYTYYLQVANNNAINIDVSVEQMTINENAYADFTVKLNREIESNVTVYLVNSNDYISLDKSSLTFTKDNWSTPQTVRVTATHQADNYDTLLSNITLSCERANSKNITVTVNNIDTPPVTYYSITNNLTGCTSSNTSTQVEENTSYSATINLNDNYQLQSLTVTMGDTDITSTAVSGTNISIANVTGNIVITALATYVEVEGTNILPVFANWTNDTVAPNAISDSNSLSATFTFTAKSQGIRYDIPTDVISANQGKKLVFRADEITLNDEVTNVGIDLKHGTGDVVSMTINPNVGEMTISDTKVYQIRIRVKSSVTGLPATLKITNLRAWIK